MFSIILHVISLSMDAFNVGLVYGLRQMKIPLPSKLLIVLRHLAESLLLGLGLSLDAIGVGIGSALLGFHSLFIALAVGFFSGCLILWRKVRGKFQSQPKMARTDSRNTSRF